MSTVVAAEGDTQEQLAPGAGLALTVAVMAMVALPFGVTGTNLALPLVKKEFGSSLAALSWTLSGYSIVMAAFTMLGGTIASRLGTRRTFRIGVATLIVGTAACMAAPNTPLLISGRVVQARGEAALEEAPVGQRVRERAAPARGQGALGRARHRGGTRVSVGY